MEKVIVNGKEFDADAVANLMDDDLRESINVGFVGESEQEFVDEYIKAHAEKFGSDFEVN